MTPSFQIDTSKFGDQAKRLVRATGRDAADVLKQEGRLFLQDCIKLTPPTSKQPFTESYNIQRRAGERAVESDIKNVFIDVQSLSFVKKNPKLATQLARYATRGEIAKASDVLRKIGVKLRVLMEATPAIHKAARGAGGRTQRRRGNVVLRGATIARYIKHKQKQVGMEKAG